MLQLGLKTSISVSAQNNPFMLNAYFSFGSTHALGINADASRARDDFDPADTPRDRMLP